MIVKYKATIATSIWDTCNPKLPGIIIRKLIEPEIPTPDDIIRKPIFIDQPESSTVVLVTRKARIKDLSNNEKEKLVFQKTLYISKIRKYKIKLKSYNKFVKDIISSIDPEFVLQLGNANIAYEFLCIC
jgi:hypothetical protein